MCEVASLRFALAIAIAVSDHRTRLSRHRRAKTEYIDDCLALLDDPSLNPKIMRLSGADTRLAEAQHRKLCEETRALFESMEPVVRALVSRA